MFDKYAYPPYTNRKALVPILTCLKGLTLFCQALDLKSFPITDAETFVFKHNGAEHAEGNIAEEPPAKKRKKEKKAKEKKARAGHFDTISDVTVLEWEDSSDLDKAMALVEYDDGPAFIRVRPAMIAQLRDRIKKG